MFLITRAPPTLCAWGRLCRAAPDLSPERAPARRARARLAAAAAPPPPLWSTRQFPRGFVYAAHVVTSGI